MMKVVLISGGARYIGSYACKALAPAGYHPVMLDNLVRGHRNFVRWRLLVWADIREVTRGRKR